MNIFKDKSVVFSLSLSAIVAVIVIIAWIFGAKFFSAISEYVPSAYETLTWWKILLLLALSLAVGFWTEKNNLRKVLPPVFGLLALWLCAGILSAKFLSVDLMFVPFSIIVLLTVLIIHLKKIWIIDSALTDKLVRLASTGYFLEGKSADLRIESGLKLLETIFPLSEAIVFCLETDGELKPIGRAKSEEKMNTAVARESSWRENMELCAEALDSRQTVIKADEQKRKSARVALPLIYEGAKIGALFVNLKQSFEREEATLLEAFAGQLAQNFQRRELRQKNHTHGYWWSSLSTSSAENRLDMVSLIHGVIEEQSFSAVASSHLEEAHAIAYLDGTLAYLNHQMRQLSKLDAREFGELDLFQLLERFKTDVFNEPSLAIRRVLQTGESYNGELHFSETNKTLEMQISLVKVLGKDASVQKTKVPLKPACFLITFRDISAVKENEKLRSDVASLMSHELRTPITSIKGFAEIMLADDDLSEDSREFLTIIANESQRLSKMLTTFLSVSNLEQSDKKEVSKTSVKLDLVVHEIVNDYQAIARRKRIRLVEQENPHLPPIAADRGLIARAVSNLIDNAIRYSPERTAVSISTMLEADFLRVVVEDRGYGIHSSEHEKVWEKFYRVARDGQDKEEDSTGLGLSLVKEIVEQHGGCVEIESEVGRGSKFSFKLPRL